jgi:dihydrofolate reductase
MTRLRVHNFTISLDGYAAGPNQQDGQPLGEGGIRLHKWIFQTASMHAMRGEEGGDTGLNDELFRARTFGVGATIMGRNMFGPVRGPWPDESWRGWWGEDPPFGHDVFVLTHHKRPDLVMRNGTTFHFIDATPHDVLAMAVQAADGRDVVLGGGPATIRQFLRRRHAPRHRPHPLGRRRTALRTATGGRFGLYVLASALRSRCRPRTPHSQRTIPLI